MKNRVSVCVCVCEPRENTTENVYCLLYMRTMDILSFFSRTLHIATEHIACMDV